MSDNGHKNGNGNSIKYAPKPKQKHGRWIPRALRELAKGSTVTEAATAAGISREAMYKRLESDADFRRAFEDAVEQGTDVLEAEATRRATDGVEEPVIFQGKLCYVGFDAEGKECDPESPKCVRKERLTIRKYSDGLMQTMLKGRRPGKFRDNVDITSGGKQIPLAPMRLDGDRILQ